MVFFRKVGNPQISLNGAMVYRFLATVVNCSRLLRVSLATGRIP